MAAIFHTLDCWLLSHLSMLRSGKCRDVKDDDAAFKGCNLWDGKMKKKNQRLNFIIVLSDVTEQGILKLHLV